MRGYARATRAVILFCIGLLAIFGLGRLRAENYPLAFLRRVVDPGATLALQLKQRVFTGLRALTAGPRLQGEIDLLRREFAQVAQENARLLELREENARLRRVLDFREKNELRVSIARVVGKTSVGGTTFFTLNQGADDGIAPGFAVLADQVFVGKIVKVNSRWSIAAPLTAPGIRTAATLSGHEKNAGILEGELNLGAVLRFIPKDVTVREGTPIMSSGLEENVPRGLLIGLVERVLSQEQDLFQTAYLKVPLRLEDAALVSVIIAPAASL